MPDSIIKYILELEEKWIKILYEFLRKEFSKVHIPSHDHLHHSRVWNYAKQILIDLEKHNITFSKEEIETLMICIFFHDIGMTENTGPDHGKISANICKNFFEENKKFKMSILSEIIRIIEKHDDKEYKKPSKCIINIQNLLCISDDLDAFGAIGVYRYAEIYLLRGISIDELPGLVLENADNRYRNFLEVFENFDNIKQYHHSRFLYLKDFYTQLMNENCDNYFIDGAKKAIKLIKLEIINNKKPIDYLFSSEIEIKNESFAALYLKQLENELNR